MEVKSVNNSLFIVRKGEAMMLSKIKQYIKDKRIKKYCRSLPLSGTFSKVGCTNIKMTTNKRALDLARF